MKHIVDGNFVFQQYSTPAHDACITYRLLQCKFAKSFSHELWPPTAQS